MSKDAATILSERRAERENPAGDEKLEKIVSEAIANPKEEKEVEPEVEVEVLSGEDEEETDEENEDEETEEDDLSAEQLLEARKLYKSLSNPSQARHLVAGFAEQLGLNLATATKREVKEAKVSLTDSLKEALGDFGFLADKIGPVIDKALAEQKEEAEAIGQRLEYATIKKESDLALGRLAKDTKGESRKFESKMVQLMDRFKPAPNQSTEDYIREAYEIVTRGKVKNQVTSAISDKIRKNSKDVPSRLPSSGTHSATEVKNVPDKKLGTKGAVLFALQNLQANNALPKSSRK